MTGSLDLDPLLFAAALLALAGAGLAVAGVVGLRRRHPLLGASGVLLALLGLTAGALCGTLAMGLQGYRALTHEEVAARVYTRPTGPRSFDARFVFPDGSEETFLLAGDQLAVEARILKWRPWVNVLGLHTTYELDRVAGRYARLEDEARLPRSVFALGEARPVDVFGWRRQLSWLSPLVDAEYGSATFTAADRAASYEIRVSTSGLLVRPLH